MINYLMAQLLKHTTGAHPAMAGMAVLGEGWPREAEVRN